MKRIPSFLEGGLPQAALIIGLVLSQGLAQAATFTSAPSVVSNNYAGTITLQIGGLTNGETVVVQEFGDINTNGVIEATDWPVQQLRLTDGQPGLVIGGIVASNVPGDATPTDSVITAQVGFDNNHVQHVAGRYFFKLSSPTGRFTPITNSLVVTNLSYPQGFAGNVVCAGTNVPNAIVLLFAGSAFNGTLQGGVVADSSGHYTLTAPSGTYGLAVLKMGYLPNLVSAPVLTLGSTTITTNLSLVAATNSITGQVVDAANASLGLPGVMVTANSTNGLMALCVTDTNGNFTLGVTSGQWPLRADNLSLSSLGYVGPRDHTYVNAGATGITLAAPKATALFYGSVKDGLGSPFAGMDLWAEDDNNQYGLDAYTDANGSYYAGVVGGLVGDSWHLSLLGDGAPTNYVFSRPAFPYNGGTNLSVGQALQVDFVGLLATNHISGWLKDGSGNPIGNIWIWATATIGGATYYAGADTAGDGTYSFNVCNGTWLIGVNSGTCSDCLDCPYLVPSAQWVTLSNNSTIVNFVASAAQPLQIITTSLPNGTYGVWYSQWLQATGGHGTASWSWNGNTPPGLNLSPQGTIAGYPGANGTFVFTVTAYDAYPWCGSTNQTLSLTIGSSCSLQITTTSLPDATNDIFYSQQLQCTCPQGSVTWSSTNLPAWLDLSPSGLLSGTPTAGGTNSFWVHATDSVTNADQLLLLSIISPPPADVVSYSITKMQSFYQLDAATLVPDTNHGPCSAAVNIIQSALDSVPIANVYLPGGGVRGFPRGSTGIELQVRDYFASQAAVDAVYTNGDYTFALATRNNGFQFPVLTLPPAAYPAGPRLSNFAAAQAINPASPFTLQWTPPPDATTNDFIWLFIVDGAGTMVFSTPYPATNAPAALRGTATSVVIPTNTCQLGNTYAGVIVFFRLTSVNTTAYPGAVGLTLIGSSTAFPMAAPSASAPLLSQPTRFSSTQFGFVLSGVAGQDYTVLVATNAAWPLSNWSTVLTTNLSGSSAFIQDNQATNQRRFYRVKTGP